MAISLSEFFLQSPCLRVKSRVLGSLPMLTSPVFPKTHFFCFRAIHFFHRLSAYGEMNVVKSRRVLAFVVMLLDSEIQILRSNWS